MSWKKFNNPRRITKSDKDVAKRRGFKDIKSLSKLETFIKLRKRILLEVVFFAMKIKKHPNYVSKQCCEEKHVDLSLIGEGQKKYYGLIKNFHTFINYQLIHRGKNIFIVIVYMLSLQNKL